MIPTASAPLRHLGLLALALAAAGCGSSSTSSIPDPGSDPLVPRTRYSFNNQCFALKSVGANRYVVADSASSYAATAEGIGDAEGFFLKPSALGEYLLYDRAGNVAAAGVAACLDPAALCTQPLDTATDAARFVLKAAGDATAYPAAPAFDTEPAAGLVAAYRGFTDPQVESTLFTLAALADGQRVTAGTGGALGVAAPDDSAAQQFQIEALSAGSCGAFPEAESNASGTPFSGTTADNRVLGMADVHVHIVSTTFLGGAFSGTPFHPLGVTHALADCAADHGEGGSRDVVGTFLVGGEPGHATAGWPDFPAWPAAHNLTHQAIYWKWLERAWMAGLRVAVNDLVENGTLCELQRSNSQDPDVDCNEMNAAGRQAGTIYAMQDYIDAQHGGPGAGWFRIVHGADEARGVIEQGKLAVVLGIEVSNFLDCQPTYNPLRQQEPHEETGSGASENAYECAMTETGAPNEILTQLQRIHGWGVRQVISIHEFDNAFGGNGVFFPIINIGNKENSGGIPAGDPNGGFASDPESPTGEFWTTYNCPEEGVTAGFSGYLWEDRGGAAGEELRRAGLPNCNPADDSQCAPTPPGPPACVPAGQGGRYGGATACYPDARQCNARWMTPIGLYMYGKLMEMGFIFDFDHMELAMKTQALELAEAQPIRYPFVSTHGTFGGTTNDQARRVLFNGGFLYPSIGSAAGLAAEMQETLGIYDEVFGPLPPAQRPIFGFGFGTDTNGLSAQAGEEPDVTYPYTLFSGGTWGTLPDFAQAGASVVFEQPRSGNRSWHITEEGSAQYGMLSDMVRSLQLHGTPEQMRHMFNSAERFLQTWERTEDAQAAIDANGGLVVPPGVLRPAPLAGQTSDIP